MPKTPKYFCVYVDSKYGELLKHIKANIAIIEKENCLLIPCTGVENNGYFLRLIFDPNFPLSQKNNLLEIDIPTQNIHLIYAFQSEDLRKTLGFHNN